ncbi:MAG: IPExxxVDY family protein, partial [Bacteroidetes bacterium]|nr:IPExxxVDY family protein [Bacteroidota bacterium]
MKKHTLSFKPEINFSVIGIVSNAAEYKLAFEVNTAVKISLDKSETLLSFAPKKKKNESYEAYLFIEETERLRYYLVKTKQGSNLLFPDYKQID